MLKILQALLQQYVNGEFQKFKIDLEKAEESESKLPTSVGLSNSKSIKKKKKAIGNNFMQSDPIDYTVHGIFQAIILEWIAVPFSRGSFQPRDQTQVSRITGRFFISWTTREAQEYGMGSLFLQQIFPTQELK